MFSSGFIDINGLYWSYNHKEVCRNLLEDTYQVMSRCLQRLKLECGRIKCLLEKTEHIDVPKKKKKTMMNFSQKWN